VLFHIKGVEVQLAFTGLIGPILVVVGSPKHAQATLGPVVENLAVQAMGHPCRLAAAAHAAGCLQGANTQTASTLPLRQQ